MQRPPLRRAMRSSKAFSLCRYWMVRSNHFCKAGNIFLHVFVSHANLFTYFHRVVLSICMYMHIITYRTRLVKGFFWKIWSCVISPPIPKFSRYPAGSLLSRASRCGRLGSWWLVDESTPFLILDAPFLEEPFGLARIAALLRAKNLYVHVSVQRLAGWRMKDNGRAFMEIPL